MPKKAKSAASISGGVCEHGSVHLHLFDDAGKVFAEVCMDKSVFLDMVEDVLNAVDADLAAADPADPIGRPEGNA